MTLTKEWLLKTISELEEERDAIPGAVNEDAAMALEAMKLALASLGAEPVGYFYADKPGDWYQISDGDRVPDHRRIPLYSSPQSGPVVKLPNEFISNEGIVVQIEKVMAVLAVAGIRYERKGNACRAAMLQGAAGNSPAIPDGWVTCSERMPAIGVPVITCCGDVVQYAVYAWDGKEWQDWYEEYDKLPSDTFTHWHPRPAAPQHEVK